MHTIEVKRNGEWIVLTTVRPEASGGRMERPERTLERAERTLERAERTLERARSMLRRWAETYWSIHGENAELRLV